jgi:hypothetical protein
MRRIRHLAWSGLLVIVAAALWRNLPRLAPGMLDWAEPGNVAAALAQGRGFSDPFGGGTGATAWVSPLPAWIEALVFLAFGVKSAASAKALLVLTVLGLGAANALLVAAMEPFGAWAAAAASASFLAYAALVPSGPLEVLSEAWLDILLSAALLWAALGAARNPRGRAGAALVAVSLLAPLDNAGLAAAAALVLLAVAWPLRRDPRALAVPAAAAAAALLVVSAWTWRNASALGRLIPLKSNFWFELHLANVDSPDGLPRTEAVLRALPYFDPGQFARYAALGEAAYVDSFRAPSLAALRADPLHFAGNVLRRATDAAVFCRREGGGAFTRAQLDPTDAARLAAAGELLAAGASGAYWTRIDAPLGRQRALFASLGLKDGPSAWGDWAVKRLAYDQAYRGPLALAAGYVTAGVPVAALLLAALLCSGRPPPPAAWAAAIGFGMLLPFVLVNHNERHQLPLIAMQSAAIGAFAQAAASRLRRASGSP